MKDLYTARHEHRPTSANHSKSHRHRNTRRRLQTLVVVSLTVFAATGCAPRHPRTSLSTVPTGPLPLVHEQNLHLVSLGDSITFGEHLPGSKLPLKVDVQGTPSPDAFPFLVAKDEKWKVSDLGMAGYTSGHLLTWMKQPKIQRQIATADVLTLDIGSNDLLHAAYGNLEQMLSHPSEVTPSQQQSLFHQALADFQSNLPKILHQIRRQTRAPIILMTLYDPFPDETTLHAIAEPLLAQANQIIVKAAVANDCLLVNTYHVINHQQDQLTRLTSKDIHPSIAGQKAIAQAVEAVIANPSAYEPTSYTVISHQVNVHSRKSVFSRVEDTLAVGDIVRVVSRNQKWITISQDGEVGYITPANLQVVSRPWPIVEEPAKENNQPVNLGWLRIGTQTEPLLAIVWNSVVYTPMKSLLESMGARSSTNAARGLINVQTIDASGLAGWWMEHQQPTPNPYFWPPLNLTTKLTKAEKYALSVTQTSGGSMQLNLQTTDYLVQIDGEPVRLQAPVIEIGNDLYLPAKPFWQAVGGHAQGHL